VIERLRNALAALGIEGEAAAAALVAADDVRDAWLERDAAGLEQTAKVMLAFREAGITDAHLHGTLGYGYHDFGRESFETILARVMDAQAAFVRPQLATGTQAIVHAIAALASGGVVCSLTGRPYDTLRLALVDHPNALCVADRYEETSRAAGGSIDWGAIEASLRNRPAVAFIQRSRGYAPRPSIGIAAIGRMIEVARAVSPRTAIVVDNCYGEFVEAREPCAVGADLAVGSLIKNPGGGMAPTGAYVVGTREAVERVAQRFFAPGLDRAVGPSLDFLRPAFAGLHRAPRCVAESLKIMDFTAALFARLGFDVGPRAGAERTDIIQSIALGDAERLTAFARGLARMLPVNGNAVPEPGAVPGYAQPVIMAGGAFITGSTMELSCDAPLREPYEVYVQGGMDVAHGMLAMTSAADAVMQRAALRRDGPSRRSSAARE